jgi:hypothetical protein
MIRETNAFLTWALKQDRDLPRIPRRRVDQGGFTAILKQPMAKTIVQHWWGWVLEKLPDEPGQTRRG